ncbi:unnamed protein product, partial [Amoebophrya sp. A25]
ASVDITTVDVNRVRIATMMALLSAYGCTYRMRCVDSGQKFLAAFSNANCKRQFAKHAMLGGLKKYRETMKQYVSQDDSRASIVAMDHTLNVLQNGLPRTRDGVERAATFLANQTAFQNLWPDTTTSVERFFRIPKWLQRRFREGQWRGTPAL